MSCSLPRVPHLFCLIFDLLIFIFLPRVPTRSQRLALAASADAVSNKNSEQHWLSDLLWKCFEVFTLFRKWTRWVVIGRRIDSAGVLLLSLRYLRWCHAYIQDNVKQDGMWWKSKGISFVIMYHLSRRWTSFPMLTSASLKKYLYKFWPLWRISPEEGQLCSINLWWYWSVAILLSPKIDKIWTHAVLLATLQFIHAECCCHVLICHLIPHSLQCYTALVKIWYIEDIFSQGHLASLK